MRRPLVFPVNEKRAKKLLALIIEFMREDIAAGRDGPSNLDINDMYQLLLKGRLKFVLCNEHPPYIEVRVDTT